MESLAPAEVGAEDDLPSASLQVAGSDGRRYSQLAICRIEHRGASYEQGHEYTRRGHRWLRSDEVGESAHRQGG